MSESAIHLVEEVLPIKPIRQWVISFPVQIRLLLPVQPKIMSAVLNIHFHQLYLGGFYELDGEGKASRWHTAKAPTKAELSDLLNKIIECIIKLLENKELIKRDEEDHLQIQLEEDDALARLQAGAATYRFTMGPNKGKKAFTLKTVPGRSQRVSTTPKQDLSRAFRGSLFMQELPWPATSGTRSKNSAGTSQDLPSPLIGSL